MKQVVRIIGGKYRGKKLSFADTLDLRPTPDRVRETLFNWLMHDIRNARCLDAFAGSGALGFEAFSRGASAVCFIEQNKIAMDHLKANITQLHAPQLTTILGNACDYLTNATQPFDIIFLDPPFNSKLLEICLEKLISSPIIHSESLIYIETASLPVIDPANWMILKQKKAGQVHYGLLKKKHNHTAI